MWVHRDLGGLQLPTRRGTDGASGFGYLHYAQAHNLTTERPIKTAYENIHPAVDQGARLEYLAFLTNGAGGIQVTVRVIQWHASRSSDGAYTTTDGLPLGTITAYCEGMDKCPDAVN